MYWIRSGIVILRSRRLLFVVAGMKKRKTMQNRQKSNAKKIHYIFCPIFILQKEPVHVVFPFLMLSAT